MKVSNVIETKDGSVKFEGELESDEVAFLIFIAINYLSNIGALHLKQHEGDRSYDQEFPEFNEELINADTSKLYS